MHLVTVSQFNYYCYYSYEKRIIATCALKPIWIYRLLSGHLHFHATVVYLYGLLVLVFRIAFMLDIFRWINSIWYFLKFKVIVAEAS